MNMYIYIFFLEFSSEDKEETAQWVASSGTLRAILEASLSRVSSMKGQVCCLHHFSPYDGTFERATWYDCSFYCIVFS